MYVLYKNLYYIFYGKRMKKSEKYGKILSVKSGKGMRQMKKGFSLRVIIALSVMAALLLCAGLAVSADNPPAAVKSGFCGAPGNEENVTYTVYEDGTCVISGTGDIADQNFNYYGFSYAPWVNDLPDEYAVTSVVIEEGITGIGAYSFSYTTAINRISIPSTVTRIGDSAFYSCKGLESIKIPSGVTGIPSSAFEGCDSLERADIPESVTAIGTNAFSGCSSLKSIDLPSGLTEIEMAVFNGCSALKSVTIPQGVTSVGYKAFYGCENLAEIEIPDTVVTVGAEAFDNTGWLNNMAPGDGPVYAGKVFYSGAFIGEDDADLIIKPGTTQVMENCFPRGNAQAKATVESISIPGSVKSLTQYTFSEMPNLKTVRFEEGTTYLHYGVFSACPTLEEVILPSTIGTINNFAFSGCTALKSFTIPYGAGLGANVLDSTGITEITFPGTMTAITFGLCSGCESLERVNIPKSVTEIQNSVFSNCTALTDVYYEGTEEEWAAITIGTGNDVLQSATIHYGQTHRTETVKENYIAPTCTEAGSYALIEKCIFCNTPFSKETVTVEAAGHVYHDQPGKAATCAQAGCEPYVICSRCDYTTYSEISPTGNHTPGEECIENKVDSTCAAPGSYDSVYYCTVCGTEISRETVNTGLLRHVNGKPQKEDEVLPTCTEGGSYNSVVRCTECGALLSSEPITVPPKGHTPGNAVRENVIASTCKDKGSYDEVYYCTECTAPISRTTKELPLAKHTPKVINKKAAGCETKGYTGDTVCSVCSVVISKGKETPAAGHKWGAGKVTKNPTCEKEGTKTYTCKVCKKTRTEPVEKLKHEDNGKGYCKYCGADLMAGQRCKYCNQVHTGFIGGIVQFFHNILLMFR